MELQHETLENGLLHIKLIGRLDVLGAQEIDIKFTALTASKKTNVLVDLGQVSFLASLGIRTLITSAKALDNRGGLMVLLNPQPNVFNVLDTSGVTSLIPTYFDFAEACAALQIRS